MLQVYGLTLQALENKAIKRLLLTNWVFYETANLN